MGGFQGAQTPQTLAADWPAEAPGAAFLGALCCPHACAKVQDVPGGALDWGLGSGPRALPLLIWSQDPRAVQGQYLHSFSISADTRFMPPAPMKAWRSVRARCTLPLGSSPLLGQKAGGIGKDLRSGCALPCEPLAVAGDGK